MSWPPKQSTTFSFTTSLVSVSDGTSFVSNPTIAAGDFKISKNGGALANLVTTPTVVGTSRLVRVTVLGTEASTSENVTILAKDAAGAQWQDLVIDLHYAPRSIADLAWPTTTGRSIGVEADGHVHADVKEWLGVAPLALTAQRVNSNVGAMAANVITATAINASAITSAKIASGAITAAGIAADAIGASELAADAVTEIQAGLATAASVTSLTTVANTILADTGTSGVQIASGQTVATVTTLTGHTVQTGNSFPLVQAILNDTGTSGVVLGTGVITAAVIADGAIDAATLAADMDTYQAKVELIDDDTGTRDYYSTVWFKNGEPVTSGITSPTIQVVDAADGSDLVASVAMTEIGALGMYMHSEGTSRIVSGEVYVAKVQATIASATRTWFQPVGRDD